MARGRAAIVGVARLSCAAAGAALCVPIYAFADTGTHERKALTPADQRVARLSVLTKAELPQTNAWKQQSTSSSSLPATLRSCVPQPDLSHYTISGQAERAFVYGLSQQTEDGESMFDSVTVLQTPAMAEGDWKASSVSYKTLGCFFSKFAQAPGSRIALASTDRLRLHAGSLTVALRAHLRITTANGQRVPAAFDLAALSTRPLPRDLIYGYIDGHGSAFKQFISDEPLLLKELAYEGKTAGCMS
jgi:hypothetical protein